MCKAHFMLLDGHNSPEPGKWPAAESELLLALEQVEGRFGPDHPATRLLAGHLETARGEQEEKKEEEDDNIVAKNGFGARSELYEDQMEAFSYAMEEGNQDFFDFLLKDVPAATGTPDGGFDLAAKDKDGGSTVLHLAARVARKKVVMTYKELVRIGGSIEKYFAAWLHPIPPGEDRGAGDVGGGRQEAGRREGLPGRHPAHGRRGREGRHGRPEVKALH